VGVATSLWLVLLGLMSEAGRHSHKRGHSDSPSLDYPTKTWSKPVSNDAEMGQLIPHVSTKDKMIAGGADRVQQLTPIPVQAQTPWFHMPSLENRRISPPNTSTRQRGRSRKIGGLDQWKRRTASPRTGPLWLLDLLGRLLDRV
jgi:hypothetical protein